MQGAQEVAGQALACYSNLALLAWPAGRLPRSLPAVCQQENTTRQAAADTCRPSIRCQGMSSMQQSAMHDMLPLCAAVQLSWGLVS